MTEIKNRKFLRRCSFLFAFSIACLNAADFKVIANSSVGASLVGTDDLRAMDSGLSTYYRSLVFTGKGSMPKTFASDAEVVDYVSTTKGAIGYIAGGAASGGVKTLEVKSLEVKSLEVKSLEVKSLEVK